jgi:hypothetical protein
MRAGCCKGAGRAGGIGQMPHRSGYQFGSGLLELTIDLQLNATDRQQGQPCFRCSRLHETADPELPFPDVRRFRSRERIFDAFVIHGEKPVCRLCQQKGTAQVPSVQQCTLRGKPRRPAQIPPAFPTKAIPKRAAPRKRNMVAWRRRLIPRVMQCPRQEYVWMESKRFNAGACEMPGADPVAETGA